MKLDSFIYRLLFASGIITIINAIFFFFEVLWIFPLTSFTFIRCIFFALAEKNWIYAIVGALFVVFLFVGAYAIKKKHRALSVVCMIVYAIDLFHAIWVLVDSFIYSDSFINPVPAMTVIVSPIVLVLFVLDLISTYKKDKNIEQSNVLAKE